MNKTFPQYIFRIKKECSNSFDNSLGVFYFQASNVYCMCSIIVTYQHPHPPSEQRLHSSAHFLDYIPIHFTHHHRRFQCWGGTQSRCSRCEAAERAWYSFSSMTSSYCDDYDSAVLLLGVLGASTCLPSNLSTCNLYPRCFITRCAVRLTLITWSKHYFSSTISVRFGGSDSIEKRALR